MLAKTIITSRELAEVFIRRYVQRHRVDRKTAMKKLKGWNIQPSKLPRDSHKIKLG